MEKNAETVLQEVTAALTMKLGDNLQSCCVYGSYARGNAVVGVSDINLLIVLETSDAAAHTTLASALEPHPAVDPLIVERRSVARTARCFATKFASIRHHYRVLHGDDPFADVQIDSSLEKLLCEQALRNVRMRATYTFVMDGRGRRYRQFLLESVSPIFVQLSDVLRLSGQSYERDFAARIPAMTQAWQVDASTLEQLLALRTNPKNFTDARTADWHRRVIELLDVALHWIETHWTESATNR